MASDDIWAVGMTQNGSSISGSCSLCINHQVFLSEVGQHGCCQGWLTVSRSCSWFQCLLLCHSSHFKSCVAQIFLGHCTGSLLPSVFARSPVIMAQGLSKVIERYCLLLLLLLLFVLFLFYFFLISLLCLHVPHGANTAVNRNQFHPFCSI